MPRPEKLSPDEVSERLAALPQWRVLDGKLHREYRFADFAYAFGFMSHVATIAAEMNHHPEWLNVFSRVTVDLATHDAGGITRLDFDLATRMEVLASKLQ